MSETEDKKVSVCVDACGGDKPASVVLEGIEAALAEDNDLNVVVTGLPEIVEPFAQKHEGRVSAHACSQVIEMGEHPAEAVRSKRDSSIVQGCKLVKSGEAGGFFSAGSTGAILAAATLGIGRISGVERPALTVVFPGKTPTVVLDLGANADCKPEYLAQFAHMGSAYANVMLGVKEPKVGLLNIGTERAKGSSFAQEACALLEQNVPNFVGNGESTDLFSDSFDVLVSDGFTGNVAVKAVEATAKFMLGSIKGAIEDSIVKKIAAGILKPAFSDIRDQLSGDAYGGAILLGLKGAVVIGHGATSPEAVKNGTLAVAGAIRGNLVALIEARLKANV